LLTPILLVTLPIVATAFWAQKDFHLWMVLLVLPMTGTAVFLGCRKHKDRGVILLSALGLGLLVSVACYEAFLTPHPHPTAGGADACCPSEGSPALFSTPMMTNLLGGFLLASGHVRNYLLCRKAACAHD
jgi:hypothetical protein